MQRVMQFQYYGRFNLFSGSGWTVSPSIHFLTAGYPFISISYQGMNISSTTYDIRSNGFAGGLGITKTGGFFTLAGEAVYTNLNYTGNIQGAVSLILFPAGNRTIYIGGNIAGLSQIEPSGEGMHLIFGAIAGISLKDKVWFELSGTSGNMKNYTENNGLVVYSSADYLTGKYGGRIIVPFYQKGISFFAGGGKAFYSSEFISADGINNSGNNKLDYSSYNITGGISWNF